MDMFSSPLFYEIRLLVANLSRKNYRPTFTELSQLIQLYGEDAFVFLLTCLVEETDSLSQHDQKDGHKLVLLSQQLTEAVAKPNFTSMLCRAFGAASGRDDTTIALGGSYAMSIGAECSGKVSQELLQSLCRSLKLNVHQQLALAVGLAQAPQANLAQEGHKFLRSAIQELSAVGNDKLTVHTLHALLSVLRGNEEYMSNPKASSSLIQAVRASHADSSAALPLLPLMDEENSDASDYGPGDLPAKLLLPSEAGQLVDQLNKSSMIADYVRDLGYGCTSTVEAFRVAIRESGVPMDERQAAGLLCLVAVYHAGLATEMSSIVCADVLGRAGVNAAMGAAVGAVLDGPMDGGLVLNGVGGEGMSTWGLDVMAQVLRNDYPHLDWQMVALQLDQPGLFLSDSRALRNLVSLYRAASGAVVFPVTALLRPWENRVGQLSFIHQAIAAPPDVISFEPAAGLVQMQASFELEAPEVPSGPPNKAWLSIDLISTLLSFSETPLWYSARTLFDLPLRFCPELLVCGLACVEPTWNKLRAELLALLTPAYFRPGRSPHMAAVVKRVHAINPQLLVDALVEMYRQEESVAVVRDTLNLMLLVPSTQQDVLSSTHSDFVVALAAAAADKDQLNLEKFLVDKLGSVQDKEGFARGILNFVQKHGGSAKSKSAPGESHGGALLSLESLAVLLRVLQGDQSILLSPTLNTEVRAVVEAVAKRFPEVVGGIQSPLGAVGVQAPGPPVGPSVHGGSATPAEVIEEMANAYFQKIYTAEQSIGEVIEMLKRFKTSKDQREQEIFSCMIRNLFDEYRFFHKYPEKELRITGILFGTLIQHQLVSSLTLGVALRYVLEALRRAPDTGNTGKWFRFGMFALEQFKGRLHEWPQYCSHIVQIPHLRNGYPELVAEIERAMTRHQPQALPLEQQLLQLPQQQSPLVLPQAASTELNGLPPSLQASLQGGPSAQLSLNQQPHFHHAVQPPQQVKPSPQLPIGGLRTTGTAGGSPYTGGLGGSDALPSSLITGSGGLEQSGLAAFLGIDGRRVGGASQSPSSPPQHALARPTGLLDQRSPPQVPASPNLGATAAPGNHIGERDVLAAIQSPVLGATAMSPRLTAGDQQAAGPALQQALSSALPDLLSAAPSAAQPVPIAVSVPQVPPLPQAAPLSESDLAACIDRIMAGVPESSALASPPEQVADRINFVINNVSMGNLDNKAAELKDALKEEYVPWLAHYLVQKRISTQANLHGMYLSFIDRLESAALSQAVLQHVLQYVSKLLRSNKIITNTGDRSILKNLGSFLGQLTIARNRPLLHRQLDLKELLYHGYETGRLFALTPFVAKILECAEKSKVFRPPNPWVMGLMSVLAELYQVDELKINIKFEIDLLCKRLDLKISDVARPDTLRQRLQPRKEKNPDFNLKLLGVGGAGVMMSPPQLPGVGPDVPQAEDDLGGSGAGAAAAAADSATPLQQPQPQGSPQQQPSQAAGVAGLAPATKEDGGISDQTVIPNLAAYVIINPQLGIFNQSPPLRRVVPLAVDRAIREIIQPVVERSVTIACITTKELIIKDLAMEPDENKMRKAAHLMVSSLAGSLALVTCKEPLRVSIGNHLRTLLSQSNVGDTAVVDQVVQVCSADNLELGCMLIEKAATEKAIADIDEALAPAVHYRRKHREQTGQPFYDMSVFANNRFPGALPEPLRPKPGGLVQSQLEVYEAFARLPRGVTGVRGPAGAQEKKAEGGPLAGAGLTLQQALEAFEALVVRLEQTLHNLALAAAAAGREVTLAMLPAEHEVTTAMREIVLLPQKVQAQSRDELVGRELTTIFKSLYDGQPNEVLLLRLEVLVAILEGLNIKRVDLLTWINYVHVTEGNQKLHRVVLLLLLRSKLVKATDIDLYLAKNMDAGRNAFWIEFAINLVRQVVLERLAPYTELPQTLDILQKSANRQQMLIRKEIHRLVEDIRLVMAKDVLEAQKKQQQTQQLVSQAQQLGVPPGQLGGLTGQQQTPPQAQPQAPPTPPQLALAQAQAQALQGAGIKMGAGVAAPRGADASGMPAMGVQQAQRPPQDRDRQDVTCLLEHWIVLWNESPGSEKAYLKYFSMLQQYDVTKSPDAIEKFIRIATDVCVEACLKNAVVNDNDEMHRTTLSYTIVDAYAKLLYLLVKYNGDVNSRINILQRILKAVVSSLREDPLRTPLDPRPYFRLLVDLLHDFNAFDPTLDANNIAVLTAFAIAFNNLQPSIVPAFAFAWLELISHRMFMPALLLAKGQKGWILMHRLLMDLFTFLEPFLRKAELNDPIRILYKGTLRVLLVLLHDFPEFLCDYHVSFCDVIPPTCIQLRNLILSAFPRNMRLPDPFTPNLKVDLLPEILQPPRIPAGYTGALMSLKQEVDAYLKTRQPASLLAELPRKLRVNASDGQGYNVSAMNALVIYVGTQAISQFQSKGQGAANGPVAGGAMPGPIAHSAPMDIFQSLIKSLDPEGRYLLLNAIANQLRYPNNQTHYFSCVLLYLFAEANSELVKEQITRVLLERLIVHRPHPWGLLITFIELIKNPRYNFWQHSFVHCAQEIERVFDSVARSCMGSQSLALNNNSGSSGGRAPTDESAASAGP